MATNQESFTSRYKSELFFLLRLVVSGLIMVAAVGIHDVYSGETITALAAILVIIVLVFVNVFYQPLKGWVLGFGG